MVIGKQAAEEIKKFKELYNQAVAENKTSFMYNNQEVLTNFAKYYIQYLEGKYE